MRDERLIKERYMRDGLSVRLGGLAADLARIKSFSAHPDHRDTVGSMIEESKYFIEWSAPGAELPVQAVLVEMQIQLALWQLRWRETWADPVARSAVAEQAGKWSQQVLEMSGLLA